MTKEHDGEHGDTADVPGGVHASGEHLRVLGVVAPSCHRARIPHRELLPEAGPHPRRGLLRHDVLRRPAGHARHLRRIGGRGGPAGRAAGEARPEHRAGGRGRSHPLDRSGGDLLHHLLLARSTWPAPSPPSTTSPGVGRPGTWSPRSTTARPRTSGSPSTSVTTSATTGPTSSSRPPPRLWDTWEDDALVLDRANGVFADPDKVHELNYDGEWFQVRGPLTVPRSPQGRPVLLQAGSSGRGRDFAARWAELIFTGDPDIDIARTHYKDQKERLAESGRDPGVGEDAADGLHRPGRIHRPGPGTRAGLPERPGASDGLAHVAVGAHELRLLGHGARRRRSPTS